MNEIENLLVKRFVEEYGVPPTIRTWAPGRINIIGEHTDYNGGYVLPIAIEQRIYAAACPGDDNLVTLCSGNLKDRVVFGLSSMQPSGQWSDYAKGVVAGLMKKDIPIGGFKAFFLGNLPIGAGVSSSAAMEVVVCYLLQKLFKFNLPPDEAALLCQRAEHEFAGTRCGIMDQFVSVMGISGRALLLDCHSLEYESVPFSPDDYVIVACDSRVERGLAGSAYNTRRDECEEGKRLLSRRFDGIRTLCDATIEQLNDFSGVMPDRIFRRCRHVISENRRVLDSVEALKKGDFERLGELMRLSHVSLRDDYEVSCPELDLLVDTALKVPGVLGSRLTGAGFGGCTISLVPQGSTELFQTTVSEAYLHAFNVEPRMFRCIASDGAARA